MDILLGFLPFLAFAVLSLWYGAVIALIVGAATSAVLIVRGRLKGASPKILEIGTFILFAALAVYAATASVALSIIGVRLCVDGGLLLIVLLSMALRRPFTLQYAREQVPAEHWSNPRFIRTNYVITASWAIAFLVMVIAEAALLFAPTLPKAVGTAAIVAALLGAVSFTKWYTQLQRSAAASAQGGRQ